MIIYQKHLIFSGLKFFVFLKRAVLPYCMLYDFNEFIKDNSENVILTISSQPNQAHTHTYRWIKTQMKAVKAQVLCKWGLSVWKLMSTSCCEDAPGRLSPLRRAGSAAWIQFLFTLGSSGFSPQSEPVYPVNWTAHRRPAAEVTKTLHDASGTNFQKKRVRRNTFQTCLSASISFPVHSNSQFLLFVFSRVYVNITDRGRFFQFNSQLGLT